MVLDFVGEALATQRSSFGEFRAGVFHLFGEYEHVMEEDTLARIGMYKADAMRGTAICDSTG